MNILTNAIKFTQKGSIQVFCSFKRKTSLIKLTVVDTGIGIDEEDRSRVFDKFIKLKNGAAFNPNGTGLGLYLCKTLVEKSKGSILCEAHPNPLLKGSAFTFTMQAK